MKNVITRSLSGIVYIAIIVGAILAGNWAFYTLTALFAVIGVHEYSTMSHKPESNQDKYRYAQAIDIICTLALCLSVLATEMSTLTFVLVLSLYCLTRAIYALTDTQPHAYREVAKSVLGVLYVALPMYMLNVLYSMGGSETSTLVLIMFVMIWLNDTGAFCFGSTLGKRRLCERLSPKKSWEGFWGGMLCCVIFGAVCYWYFNHIGFELWIWLLYGALVSLFATWGDLFESMLKRTVQVKDSGNLIPGHGGILDRIDSLLFVGPVTLIVYILSILVK